MNAIDALSEVSDAGGRYSLTEDVARLRAGVRALLAELAHVGGVVDARTVVLLLDLDLGGAPVGLGRAASSLAPSSALPSSSSSSPAPSSAASKRRSAEALERRRERDRAYARARRAGAVDPSSGELATVADAVADAVADGADAVADGADMVADGADMVADGADMVADGADAVADMVADGADAVADGADAGADAAPPAGPPALSKTSGSSSRSRSSSSSSRLLSSSPSSPRSSGTSGQNFAREPSAPESLAPLPLEAPPACDDAAPGAAEQASPDAAAAAPASSPASGGRSSRRTDRGVWGLVERAAREWHATKGHRPVWTGPTRYESAGTGQPANVHARHLLYDGCLYALGRAHELMPGRPIGERFDLVAAAFAHFTASAEWRAWPDHAVVEVERAHKRLVRAASDAPPAPAALPSPAAVARVAASFRRPSL